MTSLPFISAVVCTYNRCNRLEGAISGLENQCYPKELYEIIVVDNASTDATRDEVLHLQSRMTVPLRYILEEKAGVSYARNAAVKVASGEIIAFIDDDAIATPEWLIRIANEFKDPDVVCVSGRIDLIWEVPRPSWLPLEFEGYLGSNFYFGNCRREIAGDEAPFEGNLAVLRQALLQVGGFSPDFGPRGDEMIMLEGAILARKLRNLGKVIYSPFPVVGHLVPAEKVQKAYFLRRSYLQGWSNGLMEAYLHPEQSLALKVKNLTVDSYLIIKELLSAVVFRVAGKQEQAFAMMLRTVAQLGQAAFHLSTLIRYFDTQ